MFKPWHGLVLRLLLLPQQLYATDLKMMNLRGIYKIPSQRLAFLIVSVFPDFLTRCRESQASRKRMEYIGRTLRSKDHSKPKVAQQWKLKVVSENDFMTAITHYKPKGTESSSQSFHNPLALEMLTINLLKTPGDLVDWTFKTPKSIGVIPDEDIIEVFI
jgi:hypothetical protein